MIKRREPLTSETQLKERIKEVAATNRIRAKRHEARVAKYLSGRRIPMSGAAAQFKGDVEVLLRNNPGKYLIECKTTERLNKGVPNMRISFEWLKKITDEARAMNAVFGLLVIHYHNHKFENDYVFISSKDVRMITERFPSSYNESLLLLLDTANLVETRYGAKDRLRKGTDINQRAMESKMSFINGLKGLRMMTQFGEYVVMPLQQFRDIIYHI